MNLAKRDITYSGTEATFMLFIDTKSPKQLHDSVIEIIEELQAVDLDQIKDLSIAYRKRTDLQVAIEEEQAWAKEFYEAKDEYTRLIKDVILPWGLENQLFDQMTKEVRNKILQELRKRLISKELEG